MVLTDNELITLIQSYMTILESMLDELNKRGYRVIIGQIKSICLN